MITLVEAESAIANLWHTVDVQETNQTSLLEKVAHMAELLASTCQAVNDLVEMVKDVHDRIDKLEAVAHAHGCDGCACKGGDA